MTKFSKNGKIYAGFGVIGANAWKVSDVWRRGFHWWKSDGWLNTRLVYLRTKHSTYYIELDYKYKDIGETSE